MCTFEGFGWMAEWASESERAQNVFSFNLAFVICRHLPRHSPSPSLNWTSIWCDQFVLNWKIPLKSVRICVLWLRRLNGVASSISPVSFLLVLLYCAVRRTLFFPLCSDYCVYCHNGESETARTHIKVIQCANNVIYDAFDFPIFTFSHWTTQ